MKLYNQENLLDFKFKNEDKFSLEDLKNYIIDFVNCNDILDKRITNTFNRNRFLFNLTTKEDFKQEIILHLLENTTFKLPFLDKEDKLKLFNAIVSRRLSKLIHRTYKTITMPVDENFIISTPEIDDKKDIENIMCLFAYESIERKMIDLFSKGYEEKDIIDMLEISRRTFYNYKKKIKQKLIENDMGWE